MTGPHRLIISAAVGVMMGFMVSMVVSAAKLKRAVDDLGASVTGLEEAGADLAEALERLREEVREAR